MRYQKPFTLAQRQQAIEVCRSFRAQLSEIKTRFPPQTREQKDLARLLRKMVQDFVDALRRPDAKVDVDLVNELRERADYLGLRYVMLRLGKPGRRDDA